MKIKGKYENGFFPAPLATVIYNNPYILEVGEVIV